MIESELGLTDGQGLPPRCRVRRRADYQRCYRRGRRHGGAFVTLFVSPNDEGRPRLGITVSKKVGNAVVRQRVKRRTREVFRRFPGRGEIGSFDVVVHARPGAGEASFDQYASELRRLLGRVEAPARRRGRRR